MSGQIAAPAPLNRHSAPQMAHCASFIRSGASRAVFGALKCRAIIIRSNTVLSTAAESPTFGARGVAPSEGEEVRQSSKNSLNDLIHLAESVQEEQ